MYEDNIMKPSKTCQNWSKIGWDKEKEVEGDNLIKAQHIHACKTMVLVPLVQLMALLAINNIELIKMGI
jgi:hypothetical protein